MKNEVKNSETLSRRNALKYLALSPLSTPVIAKQTLENSEIPLAQVKQKIVIVGGGLAGIGTAALLRKRLDNPDITIIEAEPLSPSYQPGLPLVAAGLWDIGQIQYNRDDEIPYGVKLIKARVTAFNPKDNTLTLDNSDEIDYEQLIIASNLSLNYGAIKGLSGEVTSFSKNTNSFKNSGLTKNGLHSLFFQDGASATWDGIKELIHKAKTHKNTTKLQAIFTHPHTPIHCEITPKKIMYLVHTRLKEAGVRDKVEMIFNTHDTQMHKVKEFHNAIVAQFKERDFKYHYKHNLIEIDSKNKVATFNKNCKLHGKYEKIEVSYDFIHITPPMKMHDTLTNSPLTSPQGSIPFNQETLQHLKFNNVWFLGDVTKVSLEKMGGSVTEQLKVLVDNIIALMQEKNSLPAKCTGYTVSPLITNIGTAMLLEFDWSMKATPRFPLDPSQERWIWWLMEIYLLKPITMMRTMKGYA